MPLTGPGVADGGLHAILLLDREQTFDTVRHERLVAACVAPAREQILDRLRRGGREKRQLTESRRGHLRGSHARRPRVTPT